MFLPIDLENHLDRQIVVGFPPEGPYSAPFGRKPAFGALFEGWSKSRFFTFAAENHLDRQIVVGLPPEGPC